MTDLKQQVAANIREVRKARGLTQEQLGQLLGIGEATVSRYEAGNQNFTIETLSKIADVLKADISVIISIL
jgi:transcriptional regulator with XRE-family HTH domain